MVKEINKSFTSKTIQYSRITRQNHYLLNSVHHFNNAAQSNYIGSHDKHLFCEMNVKVKVSDNATCRR